jgi:hypothetical protein
MTIAVNISEVEMTTRNTETEIPMDLTWGENRNREPEQTHLEWHAPCGCAFHPKPFPHVHPCSNEHKRPDLHTLTEETERERALRRRRALMPDYDEKLEDWLS